MVTHTSSLTGIMLVLEWYNSFEFKSCICRMNFGRGGSLEELIMKLLNELLHVQT